MKTNTKEQSLFPIFARYLKSKNLYGEWILEFKRAKANNINILFDYPTSLKMLRGLQVQHVYSIGDLRYSFNKVDTKAGYGFWFKVYGEFMYLIVDKYSEQNLTCL